MSPRLGSAQPFVSRQRRVARRVLQVAGGVGAIFGGVLVVEPRPVLRRVAERPGTTAEVRLARVLGLRSLLEGAVLLGWPLPDVAYGAAGVEGAHGATMVAAALRWPAHRRLAAASAGVALVSGAVMATAGWRLRGASPSATAIDAVLPRRGPEPHNVGE